MTRIVVVGDVVNDILAKPSGEQTYDSDTRARVRIAPGGSAANTAAWLGHLGADVVLVARVGAADAGTHRAALERSGVTTRLVQDPQAPTGAIVVVVDETGRRTMLTDRGANLALRREDVPDDLLIAPGHLHLTGYTLFEPQLREMALEIMALARVRGMTVSVDPSSVAFIRELGPAEFRGLCRGVDVLLPNRDEALLLAETDDLDEAVTILAEDVGLVVATAEDDGAVIARRGEAVSRVSAQRCDVVDTTGAGDAFGAGFLHAWLQGQDAVEAARAGVCTATRAIVSLGARPPAR